MWRILSQLHNGTCSARISSQREIDQYRTLLNEWRWFRFVRFDRAPDATDLDLCQFVYLNDYSSLRLGGWGSGVATGPSREDTS